jgi:hypothetical protein
MCLSRVYRGKEKREALAKLPDTFCVWKRLLSSGDGIYLCCLAGDRIHAGRMRASYLGMAYEIPNDRYSTRNEPMKGRDAYRCGWHAYRQNVTGGVRCTAHKKDVRAIGVQTGRIVVVLSHITFPRKCGKAGVAHE